MKNTGEAQESSSSFLLFSGLLFAGFVFLCDEMGRNRYAANGSGGGREVDGWGGGE